LTTIPDRTGRDISGVADLTASSEVGRTVGVGIGAAVFEPRLDHDDRGEGVAEVMRARRGGPPLSTASYREIIAVRPLYRRPAGIVFQSSKCIFRQSVWFEIRQVGRHGSGGVFYLRETECLLRGIAFIRTRTRR
jgi:GTP cyclohydrolase II